MCETCHRYSSATFASPESIKSCSVVWAAWARVSASVDAKSYFNNLPSSEQAKEVSFPSSLRRPDAYQPGIVRSIVVVIMIHASLTLDSPPRPAGTPARAGRLLAAVHGAVCM